MRTRIKNRTVMMVRKRIDLYKDTNKDENMK